MAEPGSNTVIVTGGAGYIGSHACKSLAGHGYLPVCYDNLSSGHRAAVQWGPLETGDILDRDQLDSVFRKYRPLAVMHFAALSLVAESEQQPWKYYTNNITGSLSLLNAMRDHDVRYLVFSSTCAVYGKPQQIPIPEDHPTVPVNTYGNTKLAVENMIDDFSRAGHLRYIALRYFNAAGADPDYGIGEDHTPETHLVPLAMQVAAGQKSRLDIYGTDYETPDGTAIRDYIHVNDIASAHVLSLRSLLDGGASAKLNLGTGTGTSVREIITAVETVSGRNIPVACAARRQGDPPVLIACPSARLNAMGWRPVYTDLRKIVQTAWHWHNSFEHVA